MTESGKNYFMSRRTIRCYDRERGIDPAMLASLIDAARMAPNTGNMQLYSVIVTTDEERLALLAREGHFNQPAAAGARAILTFCIDLRRFSRWCRFSGTEPSLGNLQGLMWGAVDTSIFAQQFVTLAEMSGLGTCYLGTTTYNAPAISRILGLPEGVLPLIAVSLGWPAEEGDPKQRLPLEAVMHMESYRDPADDGIAAMYRPTEESAEARRFVEENGLPSLAHVFTRVRYPREGAEAFSRVYLDEIRKAGFDI